MTQAASMDFFQSQDDARRRTVLLVAYYAVAVGLIIVGVYLAFAATFLGVQAKTAGEVDVSRLWNPEFFLWVTGATLAIVVVGTLFKIQQLSAGGETVARMMGGRPVSPSTADPEERKLLNVVEEMAIASGVSVPAVFLLENERGINAFAAGFSTANAVIAVTRGCMQQLSRDELQGVIAHEFSHILNGDMRLNIRLMGVLNGILVIGIVGYWILRTTMYSGRSRSNKKGNTMPIALLGLIVMAIGFIGVFFGKLIKSAVSRQREFLADASAVQFTRNPDGISGALKRIGGYTAGSRIQDRHAEEASHFFFANGLAGSLLGLMATHPPLAERIRRIDPSFDGSFQRATATAPGAPGAAGFAATPGGRLAVQPEAVVARVGAPRREHIDYASKLIDRLPDALIAAAREPFGARALVYCLLLNRETNVREAQLQGLAKQADAAVYEETVALRDRVAELGAEARLPLLDLAMGGLKQLSEQQYATFKQNVQLLVEADREIDLFEYTLQRGIVRHLDPLFARKRPSAVRYTHLNPLLPHCGRLLSCLAAWGADTAEAADSAFAKGVAALRTDAPVPRAAPDRCGLQMLDESLDVLNQAAAPLKKRILTACVACIAADGYVTVEEAELIRTVADTLECPIPPLLAGQEM